MSERDSLQDFADHLPQPAWIADGAGSIYWCNRRWREHAGEAARGWNWLQLIQPEHAPAVERLVRRAVALGEPWQATFPLRCVDGAARWFLSRAVPVRDDDGAVVRWYAISTDVTERIRLEDELRDATRRKDAVLAWLGHELRNPLTPILTSAHLLTMIAPGIPDLQEARDTIVRQTRQLSNLIENLLDAGRISFGKLRLRRTQVELAPLIAQAVEGCRAEIDRRRHRLDLRLDPKPVLIDADATRIVQMLSNLLTNAAKYMTDGGVIELGSHRAGDFVVVRVRDRGIGIAPDVLSRVFEPYVQVGVGAMHAQGLGIGLTLVKSIAEGHGGTAEARSEGVNQGSEFIVRLPASPPTGTSSRTVGAPA